MTALAEMRPTAEEEACGPEAAWRDFVETALTTAASAVRAALAPVPPDADGGERR